MQYCATFTQVEDQRTKFYLLLWTECLPVSQNHCTLESLYDPFFVVTVHPRYLPLILHIWSNLYNVIYRVDQYGVLRNI